MNAELLKEVTNLVQKSSRSKLLIYKELELLGQTLKTFSILHPQCLSKALRNYINLLNLKGLCILNTLLDHPINHSAKQNQL